MSTIQYWLAKDGQQWQDAIAKEVGGKDAMYDRVTAAIEWVNDDKPRAKAWFEAEFQESLAGVDGWEIPVVAEAAIAGKQ